MNITIPKNILALLLTSCVLTGLAPSALAQADESIFNVVNTHVHVDVNAGNDQNTGLSANSKVRSLERAMQIARAENIANRSVKINVYPGTYPPGWPACGRRARSSGRGELSLCRRI
ncbi:MAG: hypothetical protein ACFCU3_03255 [Verrucomicrobiales bacterium]